MGDVVEWRRRPLYAPVVAQAAQAAGRAAAREAARAARDFLKPPPTMAPTPSAKRYKSSYINYAGKRGRYRTIKREPYDRKEIRNRDTNRNFASQISTSGEVLFLNPIAQGDGESERAGRVIKPLAVFTRFLYNGASATDEVSLRCILVQDRMPDGTTAAIAEVLDLVTPYGLTNFDNHTRFNILYDKVVRCAPIDNSVRAKQFWEFSCPMTSCGNIYYSDAGSGISSVTKGTIYLMLVPDATMPVNSLQAYSRLTYVDL